MKLKNISKVIGRRWGYLLQRVKKEMAILKKICFGDHLTLIPTIYLQDKDMSYEAQGLLCEIISYPKDIVPKKDFFIRPYCDMDKVNQLFEELIEKGYLWWEEK